MNWYTKLLIIVVLCATILWMAGCSEIDYPTDTLDKSPYDMSGGSIVIDGGAEFAYLQQVSITCSVDNAVQMQFSHDAINWSDCKAYSQTAHLILPLHYGEQTVYGQFFNSVGNSIIYSDSIYFIERLIYQPGTYLGGDVAVSDDGTVVVCGSYEGITNIVYVFRKQEVDWDCTLLKPTDIQTGDKFGYSVALSGDGRWLFAGAPVKKAVYVFEYSDGWQLRQVIQKNSYSSFGYSLSTDGNGNYLAVVSYEANRYDIFKRSQTTFIQHGFGIYTDTKLYEVTLNKDGSLMFIGIRESSGEKVSVYTMNSSIPICHIVPPGSSITYFGTAISVSRDGSICVIGAPGYDSAADDDKGCFYVYQRNVNTFTLINQIVNTNGANGDALGKAVSVSADGRYIAASLPLSDEGGNDRGKVQVYRVNGGIIENIDTMYPDDRYSKCYYGNAMAISNNGVMAIGAPYAYLKQINDNGGVIYIRRLE